MPRIFVSVAEDSADIHAASLLRAARERLPDAEFYGLTGPRLRAAGVETIADLASHAAMLTGTFGLIGKGWRALHAARRAWLHRRPDAVLLIDSPELHLPMARAAKRERIPVLYYVAPQTWASRAYRNRRIACDIDLLACILPFEEAFFRREGVNAEFVGHPLFEALARETPDAANLVRLDHPGPPLIALLPGSRAHVIDGVLRLQLRVIEHLRALGVAHRVAISAVDDARAGRIRDLLARQATQADVVVADNAALLTAANLVLVASGTATLHVAHYRKPMIVMYDAGALLSMLHAPLGRYFLHTPHLSLVNVLAGRRIVPEFMPSVPDAACVARTAAALLRDAGWRARIVADLDAVVAPLESSRASERVCDLLDSLIRRQAGHP